MPSAQSIALPAALPAVRLKVAPALKLLFLGACIVLAQVSFVPVVARVPVTDVPQALHHWDSVWYGLISLNGYRSSVPAYPANLSMTDKEFSDATNVAFFPAYPLLTRFVRSFTGLPYLPSMMLVSQAAAVMLWAYALALLKRFRVSAAARAAAIVAIASHPAAFFLVASYSESLVLGSMLGFVYWNLNREHPASLPLMLLHGFVMSATKLFALPIALLPLVLWAWRRFAVRRAEAVGPALFDSAVAASGGFLFLLYCQLAFGYWDLYIMRQRRGWGINPDILFPLHQWPPKYLIPDITWPLHGAAQISRFAVAAAGCFFLATVLVDVLRAMRRTGRDWTGRIALYWCALVMFYVSTAGFSSLNMSSMVRHTFGTYAILVLLGAHSWASAGPAFRKRFAPYVIVSGIAVLVGMIAVQTLLIGRFTSGGWVA